MQTIDDDFEVIIARLMNAQTVIRRQRETLLQFSQQRDELAARILTAQEATAVAIQSADSYLEKFTKLQSQFDEVMQPRKLLAWTVCSLIGHRLNNHLMERTGLGYCGVCHTSLEPPNDNDPT